MRIAAATWMTMLIAGTIASAQVQQPTVPYRRPTVSPYINLLRTNEDRRYLYQGIIRPQIEANRFNEQMQQRINEINRQAVEREERTKTELARQQEQIGHITGMLRRTHETGHSTVFRQRNKYFPRLK